MQVVVKAPNAPAQIQQIDENNLLSELQKLVDGYVEEVPLNSHISAICNEEGLFVENPLDNCGFVGTIVLLASGQEDWASLTDEDARKALLWCEKYKDRKHPDKSGSYELYTDPDEILALRADEAAAIDSGDIEWEEF